MEVGEGSQRALLHPLSVELMRTRDEMMKVKIEWMNGMDEMVDACGRTLFVSYILTCWDLGSEKK